MLLKPQYANIIWYSLADVTTVTTEVHNLFGCVYLMNRQTK